MWLSKVMAVKLAQVKLEDIRHKGLSGLVKTVSSLYDTKAHQPSQILAQYFLALDGVLARKDTELDLKKIENAIALVLQSLHDFKLDALNDFLKIKDAATDHVTAQYASVFFDLIQMSFEVSKGGRDRWTQNLASYIKTNGQISEETRIVFTSHPSQAKRAKVFLVLGILESHRQGLDFGGATIGDLMPSMDRLFHLTPFRTRPSLREEVETTFQYLDSMLPAIATLESQLGVKPGSLLIRLFSWSGMEADRNSTTPQVQIQTAALIKGYVYSLYIQRLDKVSDLLKSAELVDQNGDVVKTALVGKQVLNMKNRLVGMHHRLGTVRDCAESLAGLQLFEWYQTSDEKSPMPKHLKDNMDQFFPGFDPEEIIESVYIKANGEISADSAPGAVRQYIVEKEMVYRNRISLCLREGYKLEEFADRNLPGMLDVVGKKLLAVKSVPQSKGAREAVRKACGMLGELQSYVNTLGYHGLSGQGRLDSRKVRASVGELVNLDAQDDGFDYNTLGTEVTRNRLQMQHLVDELNRDDLEVPSVESLRHLTPAARNIFNYFLTQKTLNDANPKAAPDYIIANYATANDFVESFYLAARAGLISIENGVVTKASVVIIPLIESVLDHDNGPAEMERLLSIPIIRSYFKQILKLVYMKAYSDTGRDNGVLAALARLMTCGSEMWAVFRRVFDFVTPLETYGDNADNPVRQAFTSPYGMYGDAREAWEAFYAGELDGSGNLVFSVGDADVTLQPTDEVATKFVVHHGRGDTRHRGGGVVMDSLWEELLSNKERAGRYRTWQAGQLPVRAMEPVVAKEMVAREILFSQPSEKTIDPTLDEREWLRSFSDPAMALYETFKHRGGLVNRVLCGPLAAAVKNDMDIGSRVKPPSNIIEEYVSESDADDAQEPTGFIGGNRAITVAAVTERMGFDFGAVLPFVRSIEAAVEKAVESGTSEDAAEAAVLEDLAKRYQGSPVFQLFIDKIQEHFAFSSLETLAVWMEGDNDEHMAFLDWCKKSFAAGSAYLLKITGQDVVFENHKDEFPQIEFHKQRRHFAAVWSKNLFTIYKPLDFDARQVLKPVDVSYSGIRVSFSNAKARSGFVDYLTPHLKNGLGKKVGYRSIQTTSDGSLIVCCQNKTEMEEFLKSLNPKFFGIETYERERLWIDHKFKDPVHASWEIIRRILIPLGGGWQHG